MNISALPFSSHIRYAGSVLVEAFRGFTRHKCTRLGAALAFYTLLSLSPLLVVVIAVLGAIYGDDAAHGAITQQIESLTGEEGARAIESVVANARRPSHGIIASAIGVVILLVGASGVFVELKGALDTVWETPDVPSRGLGLRALARERLLAFAAVAGMAFLLLVSLLFSAFLSAIGNHLAGFAVSETLWATIANATISFLLTAAMFAMIFKLLPAARPSWRQVGFGAIITTLLFMLGKYLIGLYLGRAAIGSSYGAAGSLVVLLVWVYYSTQILLFGAELTRSGALVRSRQKAKDELATRRK